MRMRTIAAMLLFFTLCCVSVSTTAQGSDSFTDDLTKGKDQILVKYFPKSNARFAILPDEALRKYAGFKAEMKKQADKEQNVETKMLMLKDIDFYIRNRLKSYLEFYDLYPIVNTNEDEVRNQSKIIDAERKKLKDMIYEGADLSDSALYVRSEAYRFWMKIKLMNLCDTKGNEKLGHWGALYACYLNGVKSKIAPGFVKDYLTYINTLGLIKTANGDEVKDEAYQYFMASIKVPAYVKEVKEAYSNFKRVAANSISPDFNYPDLNGKMISLKSLRGKYVLIDVWATWCAPCNAEIPYLAKLEKDYHGKNIHFVSISVDKVANKTKWLDHIKSNKMKGIQLLADNDFSSDFIKKYNISAIPRFLLIDPMGKIVSVDAERPSDPELRKKIDKLLE